MQCSRRIVRALYGRDARAGARRRQPRRAPAIDDRAESVEIGVHRGLRADGDSGTAGFALSALLSLEQADLVESIIWRPGTAGVDGPAARPPCRSAPSAPGGRPQKDRRTLRVGTDEAGRAAAATWSESPGRVRARRAWMTPGRPHRGPPAGPTRFAWPPLRRRRAIRLAARPPATPPALAQGDAVGPPPEARAPASPRACPRSHRRRSSTARRSGRRPAACRTRSSPRAA